MVELLFVLKFCVQLPIDVSPRLKKQDIPVADATAAVKVTLWEVMWILLRKKLHIYELKNFTLWTYKHEKYIAIPKEGAQVLEVEDMKTVANDNDTTTISNVKVNGAWIYNMTLLSLVAVNLSSSHRCRSRTGWSAFG